jgi:hypothetical protein
VRRLLVAFACLLPAFAAAASDLVPTIYDVQFDGPGAWVGAGEVAEGCAQATSGRTLLRFGTRVVNLGPDALVIGDPGCPDCVTSPGAACVDSRFVCSDALGLPHFRSAARFELLDPSGATVVVGGKRGYCFNDDECLGATIPVYTDCTANQGLSVGCIDDYDPSFYCQYLDVTDVPNVLTRAFVLRVTIDTAHLLPDPNRVDDVTEVAIPGCGDGVVQPGEDCDPGPVGTGTCCDGSCHFLADGTSCGLDALPCADHVFEAGACTLHQDPAAGCLVDDQCVVPGAIDPGNPCRRCDPSSTAVAWTPVRDPDPSGLRCTVKAASDAATVAACPKRTQLRLEHHLRRAGVIVARLMTARGPVARKLTGRLLAIVTRTIHLVEAGPSCGSKDLTEDLDMLRSQLAAMQAHRCVDAGSSASACYPPPR